jgi:hypothetical protein
MVEARRLLLLLLLELLLLLLVAVPASTGTETADEAASLDRGSAPLLPAGPAAAAVVHVAPNVTDTEGDGSLARPYSLLRARNELRGRAAGATVLLRGGDYLLRGPFILTNDDGGASNRPVTYASYPGERARLTGGLSVPHRAFKPAPGRPHLLVADLRSLGITNASQLGGTADVSRFKAEPFIDAPVSAEAEGGTGAGGHLHPAELAQDPVPLANGTWRWYGYSDIVAVGETWFLFNDTATVEHHGWQDIAASQHGLFIFSFWGTTGVQACKVTELTLVKTGGENTAYNFSVEIGPSRYRSGMYRFKVIDALQFLKQPGQYWIDRSQLLLYYWPVTDARASDQLVLTVNPMLTPQSDRSNQQALLQLQATAWVSLANLTVAASTQALLQTDRVDHVTISGCTFEAAGGTCVTLNGNNSVLHDSSIHHCGESALIMRGGNWNKLEDTTEGTLWVPANVSAVANDIGHFGQWQRNSPGVSWSGVGHVMQGNIIHDGPGAAVLGEGNVDCLFIENVVTTTTFEQSDRGAYYHGSSAGDYEFAWTQPGNKIRGNTFKHIGFMERRPDVEETFTTNAV